MFKKKSDFPFLNNNPEIVYADSAMTSLKPSIVIDSITRFYSNSINSIGRSTNPFLEGNLKTFDEATNKASKFFGLSEEYSLI